MKEKAILNLYESEHKKAGTFGVRHKCGSLNTIRYGNVKVINDNKIVKKKRWFCNDCKKTFTVSNL
jgi:transposase-like protein